MFTAHVRIYLAGFITDAAVMVGLIALPFFILNQIPGGDVAVCGTIVAIQMAVYSLTCIFASKHVAKAEHGINWAILGVTLFTGAFAAMPLVPSAWFCGAVSAIAFVGMALTWPALHSWIGAEPDPNARKRHMVWFNLSWSSGFTIGPLIAGPLYDYDFRFPFLMLFVLGIAALALLLSLPREKDHFQAASKEFLEARAGHDRDSEIFLYCAWAATLVANALAVVSRSAYPVRIKTLVETHELRLFFESVPADFLTTDPATKFSWPASALALATATMFLLLAYTNRWRHRYIWLLLLQIFSAGAFYMLSQTHSLAVMMLCFAVVGANQGLAFFSSAYYSLANPLHKHRRASINEGMVGLGSFVGSLAFGELVSRYGFELPFRGTWVFIAVMIGVQLALLRYAARRTQPLESSLGAAELT